MTINHVYERDDIYVVFDGPQGIGWHYAKDSDEADEVRAYLAEHPDALVPEPAPPAPTQEELVQRELSEKLAYLQSTDWYVVRYAETGTAIPEEVSAARSAARARIDELRG